MLSLADISTQLWFSKVMAMSLPRFYKKTGLSAQFSFIYNPKIESIEINLGFYPKEPTNEEYNILFEEITDAEKLLVNIKRIYNEKKIFFSIVLFFYSCICC